MNEILVWMPGTQREFGARLILLPDGPKCLSTICCVSYWPSQKNSQKPGMKKLNECGAACLVPLVI